MKSESTELAILQTPLVPAVIFAEGGVDAILGKIKAEVAAVDIDISTPTGRRKCASLAYKVARSKTALDGLGKDLVADWKTKSAAVDADRRRIRQELDELGDSVRKPLTDWENAEKARVAAHEDAIQALRESLAFYENGYSTSGELRARLVFLENQPPRDWQEFAKRAADTFEEEISKTKTALALTIDLEAAAAEAARLEREQAIQAQRERDALIAENARREAEAKAAAIAEAEAKRAAAERQAAIDRERREAEERAAEAARQAQERVRALEEEARQAHNREVAAKLAQEKAERDKQAAIEAERKRVADVKAREDADNARREADKKHRAAVHNEALGDIMRLIEDISEDVARDVIIAIARGEIRNIKIVY